MSNFLSTTVQSSSYMYNCLMSICFTDLTVAVSNQARNQKKGDGGERQDSRAEERPGRSQRKEEGSLG